MRSYSQEPSTIKRTCEATEIPSGKSVTLFEGTEVMITQALGGTYTVTTHQGVMASIAGKDADALGKEVPPSAIDASLPLTRENVEKNVIAQLKTCYDPEIPHNIVDLGLVYECGVEEADAPEAYDVRIRMTLTAPGCGMGEWLKQDARSKVLQVPGVKSCEIDIVFDPPWDRSKMHPALRREFM